MNEDVAAALEIADIASQITLRRFGDRFPVELKADETPVTAVDLDAERAIRTAIATRFPGDGVLGEEEGLDEGKNGRVWIVDPLDGTKLYAEGIPLWTTLIALQVDGEVALGVADAPALGARYHAARGEGAWCGDRRLTVSQVERLEDAFVAHSPMEEWIRAGDEEALARVASRVRATRGLTDAWGHLLVAQGSMEALVEHEPCFAWDWAATGLIIDEAGGRMSTTKGAAPSPGKDLIVSNGRVHAEMVRTCSKGGSDGTSG